MIRVILERVLVRRFYEVNAGFFAILLLIVLGALYPPQLYQRAIIEWMLFSKGATLGAMMISGLYSFKCYRFTRRQLCLPEHEFLYYLKLLPRRTVFIQFFWVQFNILLPLWAYSLAIVGLSGYHGFYFYAIAAWMWLFLLTFFNAFLLEYHFQRLDVDKKYVELSGYQYWQFLWGYLLNHALLKLFAIKSLCVIILLSAFYFYPEANDIRVPMIGMLLIGLLHSELIYDLREYEIVFLNFVKNLPIPRWQYFIGQCILFSILLLPEMSILSRQWLLGRLHLEQIGIFLAFGLGLMLLVRSILFGAGTDKNALTRFVAIIFVSLYFTLFFGMYVPILLILWVIAYMVFHWGWL